MKNSKLLLLSIFLIVCLISCKSKSQEDYQNKCYELDIKQKQLYYLQHLYNVRLDIEAAEKIKMLDSLINNESNLNNGNK